MSNYYAKLVGHKVVPCEDIVEWGKWYEPATKSGGRIVCRTDFDDGSFVSTVFLGLNHNFGYGRDLWFETMIFNSEKYGECQWRYETWDEAERHHHEVVASVRAGFDFPDLELV